MTYQERNGLIMARLHQDEDFFESLKKICAACDVKVGVFLSGIGMLKAAELSFFVEQGRYATARFPEPLELVSLTGNVILQEGEHQFHVHAVLARDTKDAVGGHLSAGKVNVTNEIVILKTDISAERAVDPATGLNKLSYADDYNTTYLDELTLTFEKALTDDLVVSAAGFLKKRKYGKNSNKKPGMK